MLSVKQKRSHPNISLEELWNGKNTSKMANEERGGNTYLHTKYLISSYFSLFVSRLCCGEETDFAAENLQIKCFLFCFFFCSKWSPII